MQSLRYVILGHSGDTNGRVILVYYYVFTFLRQLLIKFILATIIDYYLLRMYLLRSISYDYCPQKHTISILLAILFIGSSWVLSSSGVVCWVGLWSGGSEGPVRVCLLLRLHPFSSSDVGGQSATLEACPPFLLIHGSHFVFELFSDK